MEGDLKLNFFFFFSELPASEAQLQGTFLQGEWMIASWVGLCFCRVLSCGNQTQFKDIMFLEVA